MLLIINGYEFGQLLRIVLWIGMPFTVFLTLVTTWLHYRRSHGAGQLMLSIEGMDEGSGFTLERDDPDGDGRVDTERSVKDGEEDYKENLYKGILWMKEKYEQYRDLADERHERLKDQLTRIEKKYEDLLARVRSANPGLLDETTQGLATLPVPVWEESSADRIGLLGEEGIVDGIGLAGEEGMAGMAEMREMPLDNPAEKFPIERPVDFGAPREFSGGTEIMVERAEASGERIRARELEEQLEEKQRLIADLEGQLTTDRLKIDELVAKLRNNSQLLMNIYQELDKSLHFSDPPSKG